MSNIDLQTLLLAYSATSSNGAIAMADSGLAQLNTQNFQDILNEFRSVNSTDINNLSVDSKARLDSILNEYVTVSSNQSQTELNPLFNTTQDLSSDLLSLISNAKSSLMAVQREDASPVDNMSVNQIESLDNIVFSQTMNVSIPPDTVIDIGSLVKEAYTLHAAPDVRWKVSTTHVSEAHVTWSSHGQNWMISVQSDKLTNTLTISLPSLQHNPVSNMQNSSEVIKYIQDSFKEYMTTRTDLNITWVDKTKEASFVSIPKFSSNADAGYNHSSTQQDNKQQNQKQSERDKERH